MTNRIVSATLVLCFAFFTAASSARGDEPEIVSVRKIWDDGEHNAFTDLIRFRDRWWCTFREAADHGASVGKVRVIVSDDGDGWQSAALVEQEQVDLRDPKLSITPEGRLMLIMGGSVYRGARYKTRSPRVAFSEDGRRWTAPQKLLAEDHWLWRVTWQNGWAYSVSKLGVGSDPRRGMLYQSRDGLDWEFVTEFRLPDNTWNASETTLRVMPDDEMIAVTRPHWIGTSRPPYTSWSWTKLKENIGGPNFVRLPDGSLWAAGRRYTADPTTVLARMTRDSYEPVLTLPSGGDCSYPGMVWHDGLLWMSYYSSHEGKSSIYLAKIRIAQPQAGTPPETNAGLAAGDRIVADGGLVNSPGPNRQDDGASRQDDGAATLAATVRQRVHPMLIRKEHNSLLRVEIQADQPGARVTSMTFRLTGTDDPNDIESLDLFYAAEQGEGETGDRFGETAKPADALVFRRDHELRAGRNTFWLSCRLNPAADLGHKVDAECTAIESTAGILKPRDETPGVRKRIGIALRKHGDDGVDTYRIPALATTPEGTLLCVYDMRRRKSRDLQEDIDIGLSRSTDGGQTWEPPRVIMDMGEYGGLPQEQNGCSDPGILVDPQTGEIFVAAVWMSGKPGKHQWNADGSEPGYEIGRSAQFLMVRSNDDGRTWSQPENWTRRLKQEEWILFAPSPQQGIALPDGTLVWPSQGRDAEDRHFSTIMVSRDQGATWTVGSPSATGNTECQAVELGDGSILLNARSEHPIKYRSVYVTRDLGKTWVPHETHHKALIEPNCNGSTYRFDYEEAGRRKRILLFANPHSQVAREHHTIQVSRDDGRSWPESGRLLLDEGRGRGYPSISRVDDRSVGIVYEGSQADLVFEKLSLEELLRADMAAVTLEEARVTVTGHDFNRPAPFPGAGDFGWVGNIQRLADGRLMLVHQWGYWHSSFAEPRMIEPELAKRWRAEGWPLDFKAPSGGRSMATTSLDGGRTWFQPQTLIDLPQDDAPYGLLRLTDGTLLCCISVQASWYGYNRAPKELAHELDGLNTRQCVIQSTDGGRTWSAPIWLESPGRFYERSHAQPIELRSGSVLWPTYCLDDPAGSEFGVIHESDDGGRTWRILSTVRRQDQPVDEPAVAELADGRLLLVCRPDAGVFHSDDAGATWSETGRIPADGTFKAPRLFVLSDGTVVCAATVGSLCVFLSSDHGRTWTESIPLDASAYGYPGGFKLEDDSILVTYVERGRAPSRIYAVRFHINNARDGIVLAMPENPPAAGRR